MKDTFDLLMRAVLISTFRHIDDILLTAGGLLVSYGCYTFSAPLGRVVLGILLIAASTMIAKQRADS